MFLAASLITLEKVVPLAVFGLFAVVVFWLLDVFVGRNTRTTERLDELRNPSGRRRDQQGKGNKQDAMTKMLEKATPILAAPLQPKSEADTSKLQQKLSYAGFRGDTAGGMFLGLKFAGLLGGFFIGGGTLDPELWRYDQLDDVHRHGHQPILLSSRHCRVVHRSQPQTENLFLVARCARSVGRLRRSRLGLGPGDAQSSEEMKRTARVIADEFSLCNFHLQMGKARNEVLRDLGQRTGVDDLAQPGGHFNPGR